MSEYFRADLNRVVQGSLSKSSHINDLRDEVGAGFDLFPSSTSLKTNTGTFSVESGSADTYEIAMPVTATSYVTGMQVVFIPTNNNTGPSTLNVDGLGVKGIKDPNGNDLVAEDMRTDQVVELRYNGSNFVFSGSSPLSFYKSMTDTSEATTGVYNNTVGIYNNTVGIYDDTVIVKNEAETARDDILAVNLIESKILASGQIDVVFSNDTTNGIFYLSGDDCDNGRLMSSTDYSNDTVTNTITLTQSYPNGSVVFMAYREDITNVSDLLDNTKLTATSISDLRGKPRYQNATQFLQGYSSVGDGGSGNFIWDSSDLSTEVTADTQSGIYVAPSSDLTGASGAWVRQYSGAVYPEWFGTVGDGITDDSTALQAAIDTCPVGGSVRITKKYLIDSALTVAEGVSLDGMIEHAGIPSIEHDASAIWDYESRLVLNSAVTITLKGGSSVNKCFVVRKGMAGPENSASAYAGIAFTAGGQDVSLISDLVIGFNTLFKSDTYGRFNGIDVQGDCINGYDVDSSQDTSRLRGCHMWPFGTIDAASPVNTFDTTHYLFRNGTAYSFTNINDWVDLTNCFSYGYLIGFKMQGAGANLLGCGADNISQGGTPYVISTSQGFRIDGERILLNSCQTAAQGKGFNFIGTTGTRQSSIMSSAAWKCLNGGIFIDGVDVTAIGNDLTGIGTSVGGTGILVAGASDDCMLIGNSISDFTNALDFNSIKSVMSKNNRVVSGNIVNTALQEIASASTLPLRNVSQYDAVLVTGTTSFGQAERLPAGARITLVFADALNVYHGGTIYLNGGATYTTTANDTLTLVSDGTKWVETGRSVN